MFQYRNTKVEKLHKKRMFLSFFLEVLKNISNFELKSNN